jgi:hypothetical protein
MLGPSMLFASTPLAFDYARRSYKHSREWKSTTAFALSVVELAGVVILCGVVVVLLALR